MQIGDKFVIRSDLSVKDDYKGSPGYISELEMYRGQTVTVKQCSDEIVQNDDDGDWFTVDENPWTWCLRWVEEVTELAEISEDELSALISGD